MPAGQPRNTNTVIETLVWRNGVGEGIGVVDAAADLRKVGLKPSLSRFHPRGRADGVKPGPELTAAPIFMRSVQSLAPDGGRGTRPQSDRTYI